MRVQLLDWEKNVSIFLRDGHDKLWFNWSTAQPPAPAGGAALRM
jgi:hypothetical protein